MKDCGRYIDDHSSGSVIYAYILRLSQRSEILHDSITVLRLSQRSETLHDSLTEIQVVSMVNFIIKRVLKQTYNLKLCDVEDFTTI